MRFLSLAIVFFLAPLAQAHDLHTEKGEIHFKPVTSPDKGPEAFRLSEHTFAYVMEPKHDLPASGVEVYTLSYPSPVVTPQPENNTVVAEYYRPKGKGPFPAVIVLDILAGDQSLSRAICMNFAQNGIAGLFVQMAYYGPRRTPKGPRLLSPNIKQTQEAIRQTVLDCRCAAAWLEARPEVDAKKLGIMGTSLGSFMSALTASAEPRLNRVAILLGGGGLVDAFWTNQRGQGVVAMLSCVGVTKEQFRPLIDPMDPLSYASYLKDRKLLLVGAKQDDVVPPKAMEQLWIATGKPPIMWVDSTHVGAALHIFGIMSRVREHFSGSDPHE